jgi:hypothetical protein
MKRHVGIHIGGDEHQHMTSQKSKSARATHIVLGDLKNFDLEALAPFVHVEGLILWESARAVCGSVAWGRAGAHHIVLQEPASHTPTRITLQKPWIEGPDPFARGFLRIGADY